MADIFISYKREDRAVTERLVRALDALGFDVWWDFEVLSGQRFRRVVEQVIDKCGAAVVLWSKLSRESEFVLDEASYAKEQNKLCPARIDDCRLPMGFGQTQAADLSDWTGQAGHHGFDTLIGAIEQLTGKTARLGATARTETAERELEELQAFKAAQIAGTASALNTFLARYPSGAFSAFVRDQIRMLATPPSPPASPPHAPPSQPPESSKPVIEQSPFMGILLLVLIILASIGFVALLP